MEFTLGSLIGIALATMFFGYFFGLFEGRAQGYRRRKKEEPLDRPPSVVAGNAAPESAPPSASASSPPVKSWLELYMDREGKPSLDLDGKHVETAHLTSDQHQRLIQLMMVMRPWVEAGSQAGGARPSQAAPEAFSPATADPGSGLPQGLPAGSVAPPPASIASSAAAPAAPDRNAPASMVAQIDAILQARLQGTLLARRGIRLAESLDGSVLVFVGQQSYPGVTEVPDPDVQAAIHAAIAEWEKRYTPG
jgi:hypothetical protein